MPTEGDLRAAIESENAAIVELRTKIGEDPLRLLLQSALDTLSFVSKAFLTPTAVERMRTPAELELLVRAGVAPRRTGGAVAPRGRAGRDPQYERPLSAGPRPERAALAGSCRQRGRTPVHPPVATSGTLAAAALVAAAGGLKASTRL